MYGSGVEKLKVVFLFHWCAMHIIMLQKLTKHSSPATFKVHGVNRLIRGAVSKEDVWPMELLLVYVF